MHVFCVHCHGNTEHLPWLIECLRHPRIGFVVSYDGDEQGFSEVSSRIEGLGVDCHVIRSMPVAWGGASMVEAMLASLSAALGQWPQLEAVTYLSGSCCPLMAPSAMVDFFAGKVAGGKDTFITDFAPKGVLDAINTPREPTGVYRMSPVASGRGISIVYDEALADLFAVPANSPVRQASQRFGISVFEQVKAKTFVIRPLLPSERALRRHFAQLGALRLGRQWLSLSRPLAEWFLDPSQAAGIRQSAMQCFIPDEIYFQSAIRMAPRALRERVERKSYRLGGGGVMQIDDNTIRAIVDEHWGKMLFGRKVNHAKGTLVRELIAARCR